MAPENPRRADLEQPEAEPGAFDEAPAEVGFQEPIVVKKTPRLKTRREPEDRDTSD
jgi:hypothetical protein